MSTVIPIPAGAIAGLIAMVVLAELGAPEMVVGAAGFAVAMVVTFGWSMSPRFPNGGGPL